MGLNLTYHLARESQHLPCLLGGQLLLLQKTPLVVAVVVLEVSTLALRVEMVLGTLIYELLEQDVLALVELQPEAA